MPDVKKYSKACTAVSIYLIQYSNYEHLLKFCVYSRCSAVVVAVLQDFIFLDLSHQCKHWKKCISLSSAGLSRFVLPTHN